MIKRKRLSVADWKVKNCLQVSDNDVSYILLEENYPIVLCINNKIKSIDSLPSILEIWMSNNLVKDLIINEELVLLDSDSIKLKGNSKSDIFSITFKC